MKFDPVYHYSCLSVSIFIILFNIFVLILIKLSQTIRKLPMNHLLLSLAINDLLSGLLFTLHLVPYFAKHFSSSYALSREYMIFLAILTTMLSVTSVLHHCFLAIERYLSLLFALRYNGLVTKKRMRICIVSSWSFAALASLMQLIWILPCSNLSICKHENPGRKQRMIRIETYYSATINVLFAFLPLIGLFIMYFRMFVVCKHLLQSPPASQSSRQRLKEEKILVLYAILYFLFVILAVPFFTVRFVVDLEEFTQTKLTRNIPKELTETFFIMRFLTSLVNPCLYTLYKHDFRKEMRRIFRSCSDTYKNRYDEIRLANRSSNLDEYPATQFSQTGLPSPLVALRRKFLLKSAHNGQSPTSIRSSASSTNQEQESRV